MEKKKRTPEEKIRIIQLIFGIMVPVLVQILPYADRGQFRGIGEIVKEIVEEKQWHLVYGIIGVMELLACLYLIRFFLLFRQKSTGILYKLPAIMFFVVTLAMMYMGQLYFLILVVLSTFEFMYIRYLEEKDEMNEAWIRTGKAKEELKKRRKKALFFPGKYPKELNEIIRQMWREKKRTHILLVLSEAFLAAEIYFILSGYRMMASQYTMESSISGEGIYGLFRSLGIMLALCGLLMMTMMFSWFIKEQKKEYRLLTILGMRRYTAYRIFLSEIIGNSILAVIPGILSGCFAAAIFRQQLSKVKESVSMYGVVSAGTLTGMMAVYYLTLLIALGLNQENILSLGENTDRNTEKREEKRPGWGGLGLMSAGIFVFIAGILWYSMREWAESMYIHILTVSGMFGMMSGGMALAVKVIRKKYEKIFDIRIFQKYFWSNFWRIFSMWLLYFLIFGICAAPLASSLMRRDVKNMYPYDIVCMVYEEDLNFIRQTGKRYHADITVYPMIRMTSLYGSDSQILQRGARTIKWPQGQHVAVPESVYQKLREEAGKSARRLNLQGEEMHVVYQQDVSVKAHTIDWDTTRMEDRLRFGQPLEYYNADDYKNVFPSRKIVSEERACLTGSFHQGMQENLIVLSDEFFESVYQTICSYNANHMEERNKITLTEWKSFTYNHTQNLTEGPTELICIQVPRQKRVRLIKELSVLDEKYRFDQIWDNNIRPYYEKNEMEMNMITEIQFTRIAYSFIVFLLTAMEVFQYGIKIQVEKSTWEWENQFLSQMGMKRKARKRKVYHQMRILLWIPLLCGVVSGMIFCVLTGKARMFSSQEMVEFIRISAVLYGAVILCAYSVYRILARYIWKKMEKEDRR